MKVAQKTVLISAVILFLVWLVGNFTDITGDRDGVIRFVLGSLFAMLIMFRWKQEGTALVLPAWIVPFSAVVGTLFAVGGLIFHVHQFEWLGLILILYACLSWSLSAKFSRDIMLALFLLYWIHPLPGNVFGGMQVGMQLLSVNGAEWLLQCLNRRVWADGAILHTAFRVFEVVESCSGLRTAVTVLICTVGVGVLLSLRWFEILFFCVAGLVQVLLLNILRITFMVLASAGQSPEWSSSFLHDTLGLFLLIAILLTQLEMSWWKFYRVARSRRLEAVDKGEEEAPDRATRLPRFWRRVVKWGWLFVLIVALALGVAFAVYKHRPAHRAAMIAGVIEGLIERDLNTADRAIHAALSLDPSSRELASLRAHFLILRGRHAEALQQIGRLEPPLTIFDTIMKSWALMGTGRSKEAAAVIEALPESAKKHPSVAVIRAEYAAQQDRPDLAGSNVVIAAQSHSSVNRARRLFPYLAVHEQWRFIAQADNPNVPFEDFAPALISVQSHLEVNDIGGAADAMTQVLRKWPDDPRFLNALYLIAINRPGGGWEERFEEVLKANVATFDSDRLASCINHSFQLNRPELAWLAYLKLSALDPKDPSLFLAPALFGDVWFTFRRHRLGLESGSRFENVDVRPFICVARHAQPFRLLWDFVPLADELASDNMEEIRKKYLGRCMDEIQRRDKMGTLAPRMRMMYPSALAMAGRYQEAHACLNAIEKEYPEKKAEVLYQHALFYDNQGKWQDVYETIRALNAVAKAPNLMVDLLMVKTLMNLNLGVCAMEVAERSKRSFPGARQLDDVISAIWSTFGFKEQALFVLTHREATPDNLVIAALLHDTGRFREAEKVSLALGARSLPSPKGGDPLLLPPLAELTLEKLWPECVSDVDVEKERGQFAQLERESTSPFLRTIGQLGVEWCKEKGRGDISTPARWQAAGRDDMERAAALNRLTTLLACGRDYERAREAAQRAVEFMPASATLWKVFIALSEGGRDVVKMARAACPDDPDIWLASLVTRVRDEGPGDWALQEIQSATGLFSVGTMIRAGDFLLRKGMVKPAAVAAKDAISRGRGLLSAYVLGLSCALTQRDMKWAEACTLKGVELAADPSLFYKIMVDIKSAGKGKDIDLISALEYLRERFRNDPKWSERLGETYFVKGDTRRALTILAPVIERDIKKVGGQSLLLAAEAARLDGRMNQAIGILESAYKLYPDKVSVLNNLVYYLAQYPGGLQRAQELLPALQKMGGESPVVLDTVAKVHLRSGHPQLAAEFMKKALERLDMNDYAAQEVNFNAAEVMFRLGDYEGAKQKLDTVRRDSKASPLLDAQSRELLMQVEKAIKKK